MLCLYIHAKFRYCTMHNHENINKNVTIIKARYTVYGQLHGLFHQLYRVRSEAHQRTTKLQIPKIFNHFDQECKVKSNLWPRSNPLCHHVRRKFHSGHKCHLPPYVRPYLDESGINSLIHPSSWLGSSMNNSCLIIKKFSQQLFP